MPIKMKELPETERPYEKLEQQGARFLTNAELLAIIIKTGTKEETAVGLAQQILKLNTTNENNLKFLMDLTIEELMKIKGIGKVKAVQLKAIGELAKRMNDIENYKEKIISRPKDIAIILMEKMKFEKQEILKVALLNCRNKLIKMQEISRGGRGSASATIGAILNEAVRAEAAKIILIHNHPTGDPTPSSKDIIFTEKIVKAADLLDIQVVDHIIIGYTKYVSILNERKDVFKIERKEEK